MLVKRKEGAVSATALLHSDASPWLAYEVANLARSNSDHYRGWLEPAWLSRIPHNRVRSSPGTSEWKGIGRVGSFRYVHYPVKIGWHNRRSVVLKSAINGSLERL